MAGLGAIADKYAGWSESAIGEGELEKAKGHLEKLKGMNAEHPKVAVLEKALEAKQIALDEERKGQAEAAALSEQWSGPMVRIAGGCFEMGSPSHESDRYENERQHRVCVKGFAIGKYEITQRQWQSLMGSNPSKFKCENCPVEQVSWKDAMAFIEKLNARTGQVFRLPTEAEWEYAARAGTTTPFHTGERITTSQANFDGNSTYNGSAKGVYRAETARVGSFAANAWGLHDVHGNVWEWTCSGYDGGYGGGERKCTHGASQYVARGGSLYNDPQYARSAVRDWSSPTNRFSYLGFRLARTLP